MLVPDYDIVLTAFLAGPEVNFGLGTMLGVASKLVETLVPAVEAVGKRESRARYAGIYGDPGSNDTMTIIVDSGPGLHVTRWLSEGRDILRTYEKITSSSAAGAGNGPLYSLRLYPTSLDNFREEAWRAVYTPTTPKQTAVADSQLFFEQGSCQTWSAIDENLYGLVGLDDFRFEVDKGSSHATAVCPRAFRQTLQHQGRA